MMMRGENCTLWVNGEYVQCWRSVQFTRDVETVGKSTIGSGNDREYEAISIGWSGSGEGQVFNDTDVFTVHDLYDLQTSLENVFLIWEVDGGENNTVYYYGEAIIINVTEVYNVNDIASFNIEFQGTGPLGRDTENAIYGDTPTDFELTSTEADTPGVGDVTWNFSWTASTIEPESYQIDKYNVTLDSHSYETVTGTTGSTFGNDLHTYEFRIRATYYSLTAFSEWSSPAINWP